MNEDNRPLMVTIRCKTYNQAPYIRQCLDGFVMQKTNFRFEAIVHDDASTDGTADIVREYAEKYPDIIKPIIETENQYSKKDGSLARIMNEHTHGKYIALCEGDDYWIDPLKLQKQVDFMENHPKHSLCFCAHKELLSSGKTKDIVRYNGDKVVCPMDDTIMGGGGFMATNSMLYRSSMYIPYTEWAIGCPIGDLPLMLTLAYNGEVGFISDIMCVYRRNAVGSWSSQMASNRNKRKKHYHDIIKMWIQFDEWTNMQFHSSIMKKIRRNKMNHIMYELFSIIKCFYSGK